MDKAKKNERIYKIKNEIDYYISKQKIFKISLDEALEEILIRHSELMLILIHKKEPTITLSKKFFDFSLNDENLERLVQESLRWCIKWAYEYCPRISNYKRTFVFEEMIELFELAFAYDLFYNSWWSFTKGRFDLEIQGDKVTFINLNKNEESFQAYNRWRANCRMNEKFKDINNLNNSSVVKANLTKIQKDEFEIDMDWEIKGFSYNEYKTFNISLDKYLTSFVIDEMEKPIILSRAISYKSIKIYSKDEWADILSVSQINRTTLINIIDFLTYNNDNNCEVSHQFFIPLNGKLAIPVRFVALSVRPERNFLSMLPQVDSNLFSHISNDLESAQKKLIREKLSKLNNNFIFAEGKDRESLLRPGMDFLIYDTVNNNLLVAELKYNIPPSRSTEIVKVDKKMEKGIKAIELAKMYTEDNINVILEEYFGEEYHGIIPTDFETVVVTNEEIGTGFKVTIDAPIITSDHLISELVNGMESIFNVIRSGNRGLKFKAAGGANIPLNIGRFKIYISCFDFSL